ncbi:MAG: hypothetical protein CFE38_08205 [Comamonadaceae bacterium PBBC1]|nr:MAG: hypothetical protein CFE38_08205 [Comamonadaceae bacterium PBBC1]
MKRQLRIAILTAGRFHVLDLARELHALGHTVKFYSFVPKARAVGFGLPESCHVNLVPYLLPLLAWQVKVPNLGAALRERALWWALNRAVIHTLEPCDVVIGMSGIYLEALTYARQKYGARIVLERGSKHILAQDEILARLPGAERPSAQVIERELAGYEIADVISIPSSHALDSFARDPKAFQKCVVNPYGVDLMSFPMQKKPGKALQPTFLFVGVWSLQKGCDLLIEAMKQLPKARLIHVGDIGDCAFPAGNERIRHIDKVDQKELSGIYAQANAFVLASRQDGFGMVLGQALASGLPIVCTQDTGGFDLCHTAALTERIRVVPSNDVNALAAGMRQVAECLLFGSPFAELTEADRQTLNWSAYGSRYSDNLEKLLK